MALSLLCGLHSSAFATPGALAARTLVLPKINQVRAVQTTTLRRYLHNVGHTKPNPKMNAFHHETRKLALRTALLFAVFPGAIGAAGAGPGQPVASGGSTAGNHLLNELNTGNRSTAPVGFEENKGQVTTTEGMPAPEVLYRLQQGNTGIFLLRGGIAYQFNRLHKPEGMEALEEEARRDPAKRKELDALREQVRLETFRMDMLLEGANMNARVTSEGRSSDYTQYYNAPVEPALDVHTYSKLTFHEVYPGIDWVVYTTAKGFKYDFIVQPGADPAQIRLRFKDHEELRVEADGGLVHGNRMGRFTEAKPVSFQGGREVGTSFVLSNNAAGGDVLRFAVEDYDPAQSLTIDPARVWGTYYGEADREKAYSCVVDGSSNVYLAGETNSTSASIAFGGHQNSSGGQSDAVLVKFSSTGTRIWATFYGGTGVEKGFSCAVDDNSNIHLSGWTNSTTAIASGGHQNSLGGNFDAFLVKLDGNGVRLWGTYYGGSSDDLGYSCAAEGNGNVFLAGTTTSDNTIAAGGHQNSNGGGQDAFLVKFNGNGTRLWGTFYGGTGLEYGFDCAVDDTGNSFLAGYTFSGSMASGGHQNGHGGNSDALLVKFSDNGIRLWATYYGGSDYDYGNSCAVDASGNVFLAGRTYSENNIASGGHQNSPGGGNDPDAFLVKFSGSGTRLWGSYYGGTDEDHGSACAVDAIGNVFLSGYTSSNTAIASGGYQNSIGGGEDAFLAKFNTNGWRLWGSYYGGTDDDAGWYTAVDGSEFVFLAGDTRSSNAISSGGYQNSLGGDVDGFLVKFEGGAPNPGCNDQTLMINLTLDHLGSQTTWELRNAANTVVATGGPYSNGTPGTVITDTICVPEGCYRFGVHDAGGNGINGGGYVLSDGNGKRIIDADGDFNALSYMGTTFCLPVGELELLPASCDVEDYDGSTALQCTPAAGATSYDFRFFDPHGGFSRHFNRSQPVFGPYPSANIPTDLDLNLRVRALVGGNYTPYGPACTLSTMDGPGMQPQDVHTSLKEQGAFTAWPNPNNGERLHIRLTGMDADIHTADITLHDATGRQVLSTNLPVDQGSLATVLDLGHLGNGVYLVRVNAGGTLHESRIMVVND